MLHWSRKSAVPGTQLPALMLPVVAIIFSCMYGAQGQSVAASNTAQPEVVLTKLTEPIYPQLARQARIGGDVELKLEIRKDGSVESAVVVSGHPMLKQAALDSAQKSEFECRACGHEVTQYSLVYSFLLDDGTECPPVHDRVVQSQNHVTIVAKPAEVSIYFSNLGARSAKCLYLWRCGYIWGGYDFYYYRVRSPKCLYLWKCGYRRRLPLLIDVSRIPPTRLDERSRAAS
jgi:TonB family protein